MILILCMIHAHVKVTPQKIVVPYLNPDVSHHNYDIYIFAMYSWRSMFDTKAVYFVTLRVRAQWNTLWIPCWKCWRKMSLTTARPVQNTLSFSRVMPVLWVSVCIYRPVSCMYVASPLSKHVHVYIDSRLTPWSTVAFVLSNLAYKIQWKTYNDRHRNCIVLY